MSKYPRGFVKVLLSCLREEVLLWPLDKLAVALNRDTSTIRAAVKKERQNRGWVVTATRRIKPYVIGGSAKNG